MKIRKTQSIEVETIMNIYARATLFMQKTGNKNQWINGYPSEELLMQDILNGNSYVCIDDSNEIVGTFCFIQGNDITYLKIDEGQWLNNKPYGVVHRLAGTGKSKGLATYCLQWSFDQCNNIRVDTHRDNLIMQNILKKNGYKQCGIIHVQNGTERLAFQKCNE